MVRKAGHVTEEETEVQSFLELPLHTLPLPHAVWGKGTKFQHDQRDESPSVEVMLAPGGLGAGNLTPTKTTAQEQQPWDSEDVPKRTQPASSRFRQSNGTQVSFSAQGQWRPPRPPIIMIIKI